MADALKDRAAVTIGEVLDGLDRANLGLTILLLALPAMIPIPGPVAMFLGTCLAVVASQVMRGARRVWLPSWLRNCGVSPSIVGAMAKRTVPWLRRAEGLLRPRRMKSLTGLGALAALGLLIPLMSIALALPLPLGSILPVIALSLIALAILQRDGAAIIAALRLRFWRWRGRGSFWSRTIASPLHCCHGLGGHSFAAPRIADFQP